MLKFVIIIIFFIPIVYMLFKKKKEKISTSEIKQKEFYMKLHFIKKEKSKDSNSQETIIIIDNNKITIIKNNYGFKARPNKTEEFEFTSENKEKLLNYIVENKLNINLKKENKKLTIGKYVDINLQIINKGKKTQIKVFGMVNYWRNREKTQKKVKIIEYYNKIESLIMMINISFKK